MKIKLWQTLLVGMIAVSATPALAAGDDRGRTQITAVIPESCQLDSETFVAETASEIVAGTMLEACNTNRSFQVLASHRALSPRENVRVFFGSQGSQLSSSGLSYIATRAGARVGQVRVRIEPLELDQPIAVSFSITAV